MRSCLIVTASSLRAVWSLGGWSLQHVGLEHLYMDMTMSHMRAVYWSVVPAVLLARFLGEGFGEALSWKSERERERERERGNDNELERQYDGGYTHTHTHTQQPGQPVPLGV